MAQNTADLSEVQRLRADLDRLIDAVAELRHAQIEYARTYKLTPEQGRDLIQELYAIVRR